MRTLLWDKPFSFLGLCSHQCVQLDRESEDGRNSWGSEVVQLSNYKLWGPRIFHDCISTASGVHRGGSIASPGKRPGGGRWWFAILMDVQAPTLPLGSVVRGFHHTPVEVSGGQSGPAGLLLGLIKPRSVFLCKYDGKVSFHHVLISSILCFMTEGWFFNQVIFQLAFVVRLKSTFSKQD